MEWYTVIVNSSLPSVTAPTLLGILCPKSLTWIYICTTMWMTSRNARHWRAYLLWRILRRASAAHAWSSQLRLLMICVLTIYIFSCCLCCSFGLFIHTSDCLPASYLITALGIMGPGNMGVKAVNSAFHDVVEAHATEWYELESWWAFT